MNWEVDQKFCHRAASDTESEGELKQAVLAAADYAFDLLDENIEDDSMFCLFDWDFNQQRLLIAVSDPSKKKLAKHTVILNLKGYASHIVNKEDQQEQIQLWLHNHITTAAVFLQFSLVAAITADSDINNSILM
jgi:hypothetical protein